jgi:hypothetical protein
MYMIIGKMGEECKQIGEGVFMPCGFLVSLRMGSHETMRRGFRMRLPMWQSRGEAQVDDALREAEDGWEISGKHGGFKSEPTLPHLINER